MFENTRSRRFDYTTTADKAQPRKGGMTLAIIVIVFILVVAMGCLYGHEMRENEERARRGEPVKRHHDITDQETEVNFLIGKK